jgi:hypothetical protein
MSMQNMGTAPARNQQMNPKPGAGVKGHAGSGVINPFVKV